MSVVDILWVAIPALSSLLYALLLYNIATRSTYLEPAERWRIAFLFLATLWSLSSMLLHAAHHIISPTAIVRVWALTNFGVSLTIFGFVAHLLAHVRAQRVATIGIFLYIILAILIISGAVVKTAHFIHGEMEVSVGPGMYLATLYWIFYVYGAGLLALRERLRATNPEFRQRIDYLLGVVILLIVGNTLNLTPLRSYPVDILLAAMAAVLMGLSISHHHAVALRLAVIRALAFVSLILFYIVLVSGILYVLATLAEWTLIFASVMIALISSLLLLSYPPIRRRIEQFVERLFLSGYDVEQLLLRLNRIGSRLRPPDELGRLMLKEIREHLHIKSAALFVKDEAGRMYRLIATDGLTVPAATNVTFRIDSPLIHILENHNEALTLEMLAELPESSGLWIQEWEALQVVETEVIVPILTERGLVGFFTLGRREGGEAYSLRELHQTLPLLAGQVAIALDNSTLYAEVQRKAEELARANEELKELDRLKTEIIQNVSHELRTPLTLILGYAEMLAYGLLAEEEEVKEAGHLILEHVQHLRRLVEQLLAFQRMEQMGFSLYPFDMDAWIDNVVRSWRPALEKAGLSLVTDIAPDINGALGNESYLRQVIDNLLDNARKFSPNGGAITLRVWKENDVIYVSVSDQGIGVPPEKLPRLFDRFYQVDGSTKRRYGGMGIGLALCKEIVERHGGRIWAESKGIGKGLTVTFTIPAAPNPVTVESA